MKNIFEKCRQQLVYNFDLSTLEARFYAAVCTAQWNAERRGIDLPDPATDPAVFYNALHSLLTDGLLSATADPTPLPRDPFAPAAPPAPNGLPPAPVPLPDTTIPAKDLV